MVHAKMGPRLCSIMTRAQGPSHGSNTESGPDNGLWDTTSQQDKVDRRRSLYGDKIPSKPPKEQVAGLWVLTAMVISAQHDQRAT